MIPMKKLEITIEEEKSQFWTKPLIWKKGFIERTTQYHLKYNPPVRNLGGMFLVSECSGTVFEKPGEDISNVKTSKFQELLEKIFYELPSRNPERKPVSIVVNMNMDENSRSYLDSLVRRYTQAQGVEVNINQSSGVCCST